MGLKKVDKARVEKIRHIMKRVADISRVFNGEIDALNVELEEELMSEEDKNGQN